jgi:hypothetical protein
MTPTRRLGPFNVSPISLAFGANESLIAWLLAQGEHIVPIPGTTRLEHLEENINAANVRLDETTLNRLTALINPQVVSGARYNAAVQSEIDTEEIEPHLYAG